MERVGDYQRRVFERQIAIERMQDKGFVSDRAFDNLAYAAEHAMVLGDIMAEDSGIEVRSYMEWVCNGLVFFVRPHRSLLKEDGVRAGVDWDSVVRIDGMVKLLLEQFRIRYLPIDTPSMQERIRAVEFVLSRLGMEQQQALPVVDHYLPPQRVVTLLKKG
jgi:hypothetical protein